ncbi:MAG: FKBP-type peptidyl-prolyl cis-trans isomerase, partial [Angustibacter sp.]
MARTARSRSVARITVACLAIAALSGACASAKPQSPLAAVTVDGDVPKKPTVKLSKSPVELTKSELRVIKPGTGDKIATGQRVTVDYSLINGKDGKESETSFGKPPANFIVDPRSLMPGLAEGLVGQQVGSRVLIGIPPAEGFGGGAGNPSLGFTKDDSLIFVVDIKATKTTLQKAEGTAVKPVA